MRIWLANFITQPNPLFDCLYPFLTVFTMVNARQQKDFATRLDELKHLLEQVQQDLENIQLEGEIAPSGCWIVRYQVEEASRLSQG